MMHRQEMGDLEPNKTAEIVSAQEALDAGKPSFLRRPFVDSDVSYWGKWAVIAYALRELAVAPGAKVLDLGCGTGWTTLFLAESGYDALGIDIAPARVETARVRSERWGSGARFAVADMDAFDLGETFDAAVSFDALHHSLHRDRVLGCLRSHVTGWAIFGEPSALHTISPKARRDTRELGWVERGLTARGLKRELREAGYTNFARFYEGTQPYRSRVGGFAWQATRLAAANVWAAPQSSLWLAAHP